MYQNRGCLWGWWGLGFTEKGHKWTSRGDSNVSYLDTGLSYTGVWADYINWYTRFAHFIVRKFYHKRKKKGTINKYRTQVNGMHAKLLVRQYTDVCSFLWNASSPKDRIIERCLNREINDEGSIVITGTGDLPWACIIFQN